MKIKVTAEDIEKGVSGVRACPIALAFKRATGIRRCEVCFTTIYWDDQAASLPLTASRFIQGFDAGKAVNPFEFEVEITGR